MYFMVRFCPCFFGESGEIWFTNWDSFRTEIGPRIVNHVLKYRFKSHLLLPWLHRFLVNNLLLQELLRTQLTIAPNFFSKLTKLKTKFGISCSKEWVNTILKSICHPVLCISYLVFALVFLENLTFGLRFG